MTTRQMADSKRRRGGLTSRKTFFKGTGAVLVLVAAGGVWRAADQGVFSAGRGPSYEPWEDWRGSGVEGPLALVPAAILAANAPDTQPWLSGLRRRV